jgi:DNA-binding NtrC family response regulator
MANAGRILLVDDDESLASSVQVVLETNGYEVTHVDDGREGLRLATQGDYDLVVTDFRMPGMPGTELLEKVLATKPQLPVVLMTAFSSTNLAIDATKKGAFDYLIKPFEMPDLLDIAHKAVTSWRLSATPVNLGPEASPDQDAMIGNSRKMQQVFKDMGRLAAKPVPVLVRGETGTGKELVARALYHHSDRRQKTFVAVNCAAIPESLIESELFGHEKGAFTNAVARRIGRFEQADQGTLFLDEIGDLPPDTQVKLLRVLQQKTICRLGGNQDIPIDVRIISATHRDLEAMVQEGTFREDLYYRLNVAAITLPPLRERIEDVEAIARYFLARYAREFEIDVPVLQSDALELLRQQPWRGNVRELENVIRKLLVQSQGRPITAVAVKGLLHTAPPGTTSTGPTPAETEGGRPLAGRITEALAAAERGELPGALEGLIEELERELYTQAFARTKGNQSAVSKLVGVSRLTVREKLLKYGLLDK